MAVRNSEPHDKSTWVKILVVPRGNFFTGLVRQIFLEMERLAVRLHVNVDGALLHNIWGKRYDSHTETLSLMSNLRKCNGKIGS